MHGEIVEQQLLGEVDKRLFPADQALHGIENQVHDDIGRGHVTVHILGKGIVQPFSKQQLVGIHVPVLGKNGLPGNERPHVNGFIHAVTNAILSIHDHSQSSLFFRGTHNLTQL